VLCLASALGILLLTPIYQAWQEEGWPRSRELALILLGLALLLLIQQITLRFDASLIYLTIPILLLVAMTSRALIATVATLTLSIATVGATAGAYGPFVGPEGSVTYLPLMVYLLALATSSLLGRTQYMQVRRSEQELSRLVDERTAALREEVAQRTALGDQMAYHIRRQEQAQAALEEERARLAERVAERTRELQITNLHLAQAAKAKDEFLASMSHELRTPLNTVLMLAELIECETAGPVTEKQRNYLQTMRDSGGHLLGLINDVLDLAKIDAQKLVIEQGSVVVTELCDASMGLIAGQAQQKQIRYTLKLDPQVTAIQADARRTKQILVNLLGNAVKFTPNEGSIGLTVTGDAGAGRVRFVVWDTGIGIHEEDREHLFEPFFQSDSTLARRYEGTGLGLSLARRLARLQGGDITLESEVGKGSRFTLCLPWVEPEAATTAAQPAEAVTTSAAAAHRGADGPPATLVSHRSPAPLKGELVPSAPMDAEESAGRPAGAPRHVLVVDDTQSFLNAARDYLLLRGYAVSTAGGGNEAIASVRANRPDLILMDIQMPGMDGLEVTQTLRLDPKVAQVPIIALTALAMPGDRERCLAAGMVDYCTKPISLLQLSQVVAKHLGAAPTP
jgi:signal transduction histidine kinase/ActR/RegA family two-component response regulator